MKICVYAIAHNEQKFIQRFIEAAWPADLILIADTGSTDDTVKLASEYATKTMVRTIYVWPWRFDKARDAALAMVPKDIDVCVSLDLDEVLQPGWREKIESVWKVGETTRLRYLFDWGIGVKFYYEKIHARFGYHWHHPCHEYPRPDGRIKEVYATVPELLVVHQPDPGKSRGQYLDLLKLSVEEDPICPRNAFYYARELSFVQRWEDSIKECDRYLALPGATWPNERCYAHRVRGRCFTNLGRRDDAYGAFLQAAAAAPNTREPWYELAELMESQERWAEMLSFSLRCLQVKDKELVYTVDPVVWGLAPHDNAAIAAHYSGLRDLAIEHGNYALAFEPGSPRLRDNLRWYTGELRNAG
jgi:glycosyltransferase involved in cell wall biosynthesis